MVLGLSPCHGNICDTLRACPHKTLVTERGIKPEKILTLKRYFQIMVNFGVKSTSEAAIYFRETPTCQSARV